MPIYKLSTSHQSAGVRHSQPPPSDALSVGEKKANGDVVHSENRGHYQDNPYTQRPSPAEREIDYFDPKKSSSFNRKESIIEREIREQLRRESELAALRGLPTLQVKVPVDQVDQNQDHHHNHRTPDPSWNYYDVQMLPPEQHRNSSREERKLTVIRSPGGATSSTTTITTTTSSVNGSKPGKVDYRRGGHDMAEQKGREKEEEEDRRGQWKERGVDLEVETLENGKWTERKRTEKNDDVLDSGVIVGNAEKTEEKESPGEERHSSSSVREPWSPAGDVQRNLHRVQPFEEVDSIQSELFAQYVPQNETPIEREIRRANKRESDLRVARGLVSLVSRGDSEGGAETEEIEVVVMRPPRTVEGGGGGDHSIQEKDAMKRFSESRLRAELEREKRREIDLLREGKIKLLSEQRVPELLGPSSSSRNRVSSETEELREFSARRRSIEHRDSERDVVTAPGAGRRNADAVENRTASSANPRMSYGGGGGGCGKGVTVVRSDARNVNGSGEGVFMRTTHSATEAERRIENEIVELRKRESELREQRRSRIFDIPVEETRAAQPEVVEEYGGAHAQAAKPEVVVAPTSSEAARRRQQPEPEPRFDLDYDSVDLGRPARLALIDQWERGIIQRGGITT